MILIQMDCEFTAGCLLGLKSNLIDANLNS